MANGACRCAWRCAVARWRSVGSHRRARCHSSALDRALSADEIGEWAVVCLGAEGVQEPLAPPVDLLPAESVANVDESLLESTVDDGAPDDTPVASERRAREGTITSLPVYLLSLIHI